MRIPIVGGAGIDQLDEADAALGHAAGDEALPGEAGGFVAIEAVEVERGIGLLREIEDVGHGLLHAEGGFEGFDSAGEEGVALAVLLMTTVEAGKEVELHLLDLIAGRAAAKVLHRFVAGENA